MTSATRNSSASRLSDLRDVCEPRVSPLRRANAQESGEVARWSDSRLPSSSPRHCWRAAAARRRRRTTDLPLTFVENRGQTDPRVRFHAQGPGHAFFLTPDRIALTLQRDSARASRSRCASSARTTSCRPPAARHRARSTTSTATNRTRTCRATAEITYRGAVARHRHAAARAGRPAQVRVRRAARRPAAGHPAGLRRCGGAAGRRRRRAARRHRARRVARRATGRLPGRRAGAGGVQPERQRVRLHRRRLRPGARADHRPRPRVLDVPRRHEPRDGRRHRGRRGGQRLRDRLHAVAELPDDEPARSTAPARRSNNLDVFVSKLNPTGTALVYSTFIGGTNFDWGRGHRRSTRPATPT